MTDTAAPARPRALLRFDAVERIVHWANAVLFAVLVATGAALYFSPLIALVGRRELVERIHVYAGLALPVPLLAALVGSRGSQLRQDLRRLNRWTGADRRWLTLLTRAKPTRQAARRDLPTGKFNAGQKLNAAFTAGGGLVMLGTGVILRWYRPFPLSWREGATVVHDWFFLFFVLAITGHVLLALADPQALRSMWTGRISRAWARRHAPTWLDELDAGALEVGDPGADPAP